MRFKITGTTTDGKRFQKFTDNAIYAQGINLHRGTKWEWDVAKGAYRIVQKVGW